jgi:hypothetical protein
MPLVTTFGARTMFLRPRGEVSMAGHAALRWARALTLALVMLGAGYSGHVAGGGVAPPIGLLGPMLVVVTVAVAPFLEKPASVPRVVVLMLAAQALLHLALELVGSAAATHAVPMTHSAAGAGMAHMAQGGPTSSWAASVMACLTADHLNMLAAHLGAALVVALWLAAGERAAWTLVGVSTFTVAKAWLAICDACVVTRVVVVGMRPRALFAWIDRRSVLPSVWEGRRAFSQRGPPRVSAAA